MRVSRRVAATAVADAAAVAAARIIRPRERERYSERQRGRCGNKNGRVPQILGKNLRRPPSPRPSPPPSPPVPADKLANSRERDYNFPALAQLIVLRRGEGGSPPLRFPLPPLYLAPSRTFALFCTLLKAFERTNRSPPPTLDVHFHEDLSRGGESGRGGRNSRASSANLRGGKIFERDVCANGTAPGTWRFIGVTSHEWQKFLLISKQHYYRAYATK